jgi:endo-1,4-beta-xylanase
MKKALKPGIFFSWCISAFAILLSQFVDAQTLSSNQSYNKDGYVYQYWKDAGTGSMTLGRYGAFDCTWSNPNSLLMRSGKMPGTKNSIITYESTFQTTGNSWVCLYGWTRTPLIEYYIVDNWGTWRPPGVNAEGTVYTDGDTYDIYKVNKYGQPSIDGASTDFIQYWSVRRNKRTKGTITFANHINAWAAKGWNLGTLYEVSLNVEAFQSSGSAKITTLNITEGNPINVRAKGISGAEQLSLYVNNQKIKTWTLSKTMTTYSTISAQSGDMWLQYDNDIAGRDVQVDWLQANNVLLQAEAQSYNTAYYTNGKCGGGGYSEWMHCNGIIGFGPTSKAPNPTNKINPEMDAELTFDNTSQAAPMISPNPTQNKNLNIESLIGFDDITIFTLQGQQVGKFYFEKNRYASIQLNLPTGLYFAKINEGGNYTTQKFMLE